ncbi:MAG: YfhO family protein [Erysipelotrichaceae bacterium]|nr:YfhO family protein [Erysipelotrichaceae bacterium]
MLKKISTKIKDSYYLKYTLVFLSVFFLIAAYFIFTGRTFIRLGGDGEFQHYKSLVYLSNYLKDIFYNLIHNHQLIVPQYSFAIGEGSDILQTLHSDVYGDPIAFLSVLVPEKYIYIYYEFSICLRLYLSGLFFSKLCFYTGKENHNAILAGAVAYCFSYWAFFGLRQHIYFLTPYMYMPLIILGVEKIIKENKGLTLSIGVFLAAISQFYFFFMEAALTALYTFIRLICLYKKDIKEISIKIINIFIYAVVGLLMSMFIVGPIISAYLSDSRMGVETIVNLLYPRSFYERLVGIFLGNDFCYDLFMGYACPCLLAMFMSVKFIKEKPLFFVLNVVTLILLCFPFCGYALNGFAYVIERWSFAVGLVACYQLTYFFEDIIEDHKWAIGCLVVVVLASIATPWSRNLGVLVPVGLCVLFVAFTFLKNEQLRQLLMIAMVILNVLSIAYYDLSPIGKNRIEDAMPVEYSQRLLESSDGQVFRDYLKSDDEFYRYSGLYLDLNSSMMFDAYSTDSYWSITNSSLMDYRMALGINDHISWQVRGYDERYPLYTLANVKYYLHKEGDNRLVPYGFEYTATYDGYDVYENKYYIPFGYTYTDVINRSDWDKLSVIDKQEALLQGVVLNDEDTTLKFESHNSNVDYSMSVKENTEISDKSIDVKEKKGSVTISFENNGNDQLYLNFDSLVYKDIYDYVETDQTDIKVTITFGDQEKVIVFFSDEHRYYFGKEDFLIYLGDYKGNEITLTFNAPGEYQFNEISLINETTDTYAEEVNSLKEDCLQNVVFGNDIITGNIDVSEDKYLLLSVPYSKAWKAFVNGEEVALLEANDSYMTLKLNKGTNEIVLQYERPLGKVGIILICVGFAAFIYLALKRKRDR